MLKEYLPDYLKDIEEIKALTTAQDPEFENILGLINNTSNDFSAFTLTENGIKRWESILGIEGKTADNLDARRFRIITHIIGKMPITKRSLYSQLQTLCGEDGFEMEINSGAYTLHVKVSVSAKSALEDVKDLIGRLVPANIVYSVTLLYNRHKVLGRKTHRQLAPYTHQQLRNEVIV